MLFATLDWRTHELYNYLAVAGGALLVLSLALYLLPVAALKAAACLLSIVGGLGLGLGLGVILMGVWGYQLETPPYAYPNGMPAGMGGMPGGRGGMGIAMAQFPGAAPLLPPGGSNAKPQLAGLIARLDALTDKPLTVELNDVQRKQIKEQLRGLADTDDLSDEEATQRVAALRAVLTEGQRDALEAAGFRWSTEGGGGGIPPGLAPPQANPFRTGQNSKHLQALTRRLAKGDK